jgi:hypothetical protein
MTEICTYIWESFGGATLVRLYRPHLVCWLGEKRIFESVCIALAFLGMAGLRFGEWRCCLGRHGMVYQMEFGLNLRSTYFTERVVRLE